MPSISPKPTHEGKEALQDRRMDRVTSHSVDLDYTTSQRQPERIGYSRRQPREGKSMPNDDQECVKAQ